jgi:hypothetical protein
VSAPVPPEREAEPTRPRSRVAAAIGAAAVLLAGLVAVLVRDDDGTSHRSSDVASDGDATTTTPEDGSSTTTTPSPAATASSSAPAAAAETPVGGAGADPTTTVAGAKDRSGDDLGAPEDPGPASAPKPGTYRYRTVSDEDERVEDLVIRDLQRSAGQVVQLVRGQQGGIESDDTVVWTADRVVVRSSTYRFGGNDGDCDWEPDVVQAELPLAVGATWASDSSCTVTGFGPTPIIVRQERTSEVVGLERRRIAGEVLDLWVIDAAATVQFSGFTVQADVEVWFSPRHGLIVRSEGTASGSTPDGSGSGSFTSEIEHLSPA